jgi:hypothetical protein
MVAGRAEQHQHKTIKSTQHLFAKMFAVIGEKNSSEKLWSPLTKNLLVGHLGTF